MNHKASSEKENDTVLLDKTEVKRPKMYKVLLHNDDYTTMDFVMIVLKKIFHKSEDQAYEVMMNIHQEGSGICGVFSHEIAETKVDRVIQLARSNEFPLLCTMEEE